MFVVTATTGAACFLFPYLFKIILYLHKNIAYYLRGSVCFSFLVVDEKGKSYLALSKQAPGAPPGQRLDDLK